jgi:hypothetical protein
MQAITKLISITVLATAASCASAQWYGELTHVSATTKYSSSNTNIESNPKSIGAYIGYQLNDNFAAEGLIGTGIGGTDVKVNGASQNNPVTAKTDYLYGAFVKAKNNLSEEVEVFGRLGYLEGKTTSSNTSASSSTVKGDWAYGLGTNYHVNKKTYVSASWMNLHNKDSVKSTGWTIGLGFKF